MLDELQDQPESLNDGTEAQDSNPEEVVDTEAKLKKVEEDYNNQKIRAEKAEAKLKALKDKPEKPTPKNKYSLEEIDDITALTSIPREDRQEILDYADRKGIKPAEALNSSFIKVYLKNQAEERATAAAANVGVSKRGVQTGNILEQARRGEEVDFDALAQARIDAKKKERGLK